MKRLPTLVDVAADVLQATGNPAVMMGDNHLLDDICFAYAERTGRQALLADRLHPVFGHGRNDRHARVLNALERRPDLFVKSLSRWGGPAKRKFTLRQDAGKCTVCGRWFDSMGAVRTARPGEPLPCDACSRREEKCGRR